MCTTFYQIQLAFVEDMTKTFWCVFIGSQCTWKTLRWPDWTRRRGHPRKI